MARVDDVKLEEFSLLELEELSDRVAKEIASKWEARTRELREEMENSPRGKGSRLKRSSGQAKSLEKDSLPSRNTAIQKSSPRPGRVVARSRPG